MDPLSPVCLLTEMPAQPCRGCSNVEPSQRRRDTASFSLPCTPAHDGASGRLVAPAASRKRDRPPLAAGRHQHASCLACGAKVAGERLLEAREVASEIRCRAGSPRASWPRSWRTALRAARAYDDVAHPGQRSSRAGARAPDGARRPAVRSTGAPARRAWARQRVHAMFTWRWAPRFVSRAGFGQAGSARPRSAPSPPSDRRALGTFWSRWEAFSAEPHASR